MNNELGADQLPVEDQWQNADEAMAGDIEEQLIEENYDGPLTKQIISKVKERFEEAKRARDNDEQRWLQAYQNYRGYYAKNIKFTEHEKSRVFVKATKTKVLAAYGQVVDVLFGSDKFPLTVRPTPVPEGAHEFVHLAGPDMEGPGPDIAMSEQEMKAMDPAQQYNVGYSGDGFELPKGAKLSDVTRGLRKEFKSGEEILKPGLGFQGQPQLKPAHEAAKRLEKLIHDQIAESNGSTELRSALFEACLLGTGIIKGPFSYDKTVHKWGNNAELGIREYKPETKRVPKIEFVSIWDAYPDPNANCMEDCEWFVQRHKLSRSQVRGLKHRPLFDAVAIEEVLTTAPNYVREDHETQLLAENASNYPNSDRYEVLEYWGLMDKESLNECGLQLGEAFSGLEEVQINAWVCGHKLLRVALNPFQPKRIPYLAFDYERNPYSFFGVGVAENMSDSQQIMNGHARMAIDNLALAGNLVFDIDEGALAPGQNMEIFAGKVFKRQTGMPGQAIYGIKFPSTANENMQIFDKFRQIADESTGIPSYAHGQTGVMSTTRTASGMSMLMNAASLNVKTVVGNIDDFLLKPLGLAFFQWNMAFYEGELEIAGDYDIVPGGTKSLMQNEIKSQRLTAFGQLLQNPAIAPFVKIPAYVKAFVESLELDPEEFINDQDQASVYASIIGQAGGAKNPLTERGGVLPAGLESAGMGQVGGVPSPAMPGGDGFSAAQQPEVVEGT